jgi:pimeloyl-ACP methyl ester carboxylesterase
MPNVLYLPGFLGSQLGWSNPIPGLGRTLWLDVPSLLDGSLVAAQLGPDGRSPGPLTSGRPLEVMGIVQAAYGPLYAWMTLQGWNVVPAAFDWRLSIATSAESVLAIAQRAFGLQPFAIVAHSMGGLVARYMWSLMQTAGQGDQLTRLVMLGTPQTGTWEAVRLWMRLPHTYALIMDLLWAGQGIRAHLDSPWLDAVLTSCPGIYQLTPFRLYGPLFDSSPASAASLYAAADYLPTAPLVQQQWLDAAIPVQTVLQTAIPPGRCATILGVGSLTPSYPVPFGDLSRRDGYQYTDRGDGLVTLEQGTLPGVPRGYVTSSHALLPLSGAVARALSWIVPEGLSADIVLT